MNEQNTQNTHAVQNRLLSQYKNNRTLVECMDAEGKWTIGVILSYDQYVIELESRIKGTQDKVVYMLYKHALRHVKPFVKAPSENQEHLSPYRRHDSNWHSK